MSEPAPDRRVLWAWLWFLAGVALVGIFAVRALFFTEPELERLTAGKPGPAPAAMEHPLLEITVAGQANGKILIELFPELAPRHVERVVALAQAGAYDGVVFHRVIDGFMAQTGDVQHGRIGQDLSLAGTGGSTLPDLPAEFSDYSYGTGVVGMARGPDPDSANSQFFITLRPARFLDGKYTVIGRVIAGQEDVVQKIKLGEGENGRVLGRPDVMVRVRVIEEG